MVDFWLPEGTDIDRTAATAKLVERYLLEQSGVDAVQSLIGSGGLRYMLVDQLDLETRLPEGRGEALIHAANSRVRPVMMGTLTTVLGVMPLFFDAFFQSMAVVLVFGLGFATLLTLIARARKSFPSAHKSAGNSTSGANYRWGSGVRPLAPRRRHN